MFELFGACLGDYCTREQWWALVFSPKRACLAYARLQRLAQAISCELSLRRLTTLWASECLTQAREVSPKREGAEGHCSWCRALA